MGGDVHEVEPGEHRPHRLGDGGAGGADLHVRIERLDRPPLDPRGGDVGADDQADGAHRLLGAAVGLQPQLGIRREGDGAPGQARQP